MLNSQRTFVAALRKYCANHGVEVEIRSEGWLIVMRRAARRHFAFGYDLGLNSAVAHRIANDKAATSEVLQICGIPCVPHTLFLSPEMSEYVPPRRSWEAMIALLKENPDGIVVKPNEGTSGESVFKVLSVPELEVAAYKIFSSNLGLAISPYLDIASEVRVILIDDHPLVIYSKDRPSIIGDGKHSLLELALAAVPAELLSTVLSAMARDFGSLDRWRTQFSAMGKAQGGGSGWVILAYNLHNGEVHNYWAWDHMHNAPMGRPLPFTVNTHRS